MEENELQYYEKHLKAIETDNNKVIQFDKVLISDSPEKMIVDYKFSDGVVVRKTLGKRAYYENPDNFPSGNWGNPLLEKIEFIEPKQFKGELLKVPIYFDT